MKTIEDFRAAMCSAGLVYAGPIAANEKLHRFKAEGDKERNSWFVLHAGPPAAGAFGCWKRGVKETWCERAGQLSQDEWDRVRERWKEAEHERQLSQERHHATARKLAAWILSRSRPARTLHRYLTHKGVKVFGDLREWRGALVLPLRDASGELHSLQFINEDGSKRFLRGGRVAGCAFELAKNSAVPLVLCEGYATGAALHEATGYAVVCAMHSGNLKAVAQAHRELYPHREIIIAADNDAFTVVNGKPENPGLDAANEAASLIGAKLAVPQFQDVSTKPTDFNDLHQLAGIAKVAAQISAAQLVPDSMERNSHLAPGSISKPPVTLSEEEEETESAPFPVDALPSSMAALIVATARSVHVPPALPSVCALGAIAAAIGAGLEVISGPGRTTSSNLFLLAGAESGSGKSEACRPIIAPLMEHQAGLLETWKRTTHPDNQAELARREAERKALERKIAKAMRPENPDAEELQRLQAQLAYPIARSDELKQQTAPSIIADDFTIEALAIRLRDNRETMFCFSSDARKPVQNLLGRYNPGKTTDESLLLKGYTRESVRVDRAKGDPVSLRRPCISLCWFVQPDLLATMFDEESLRSSGLLARVLPSQTNADWVKYDRSRQGISESVSAQWAELVRSLLATYHNADKPFCIAATPEAEQTLDRYQHQIVDRRGELADVKLFAARWCENAWRVALALHAALHGVEAHLHPLAGETAANAVRVLEWFAAQQLEILAKGRRATAARLEDEVLKLLESRERKGVDYVTGREVHRARIVSSAEAARSLLDSMERDGLLVGQDITPAHGGKTTRIYRCSKNPIPA